MKNHRIVFLLLGVVALLFVMFSLPVAHARDGSVKILSGKKGIVIGRESTTTDTVSRIELVRVAAVKINNGKTSGTAYVRYALPGDRAFVAPWKDSFTSVTKARAEVTTNTVRVIVDRDPKTTVTLDTLVIGVPR